MLSWGKPNRPAELTLGICKRAEFSCKGRSNTTTKSTHRSCTSSQFSEQLGILMRLLALGHLCSRPGGAEAKPLAAPTGAYSYPVARTGQPTPHMHAMNLS